VRASSSRRATLGKSLKHRGFAFVDPRGGPLSPLKPTDSAHHGRRCRSAPHAELRSARRPLRDRTPAVDVVDPARVSTEAGHRRPKLFARARDVEAGPIGLAGVREHAPHIRGSHGANALRSSESTEAKNAPRTTLQSPSIHARSSSGSDGQEAASWPAYSSTEMWGWARAWPGVTWPWSPSVSCLCFRGQPRMR